MTQPNPMARQAELMELLARSAQGRTVYLDTETTGLAAKSGDELLEIALVDDPGLVLLDSLVQPIRRTEWPEAQSIHGITPTDVAGAPDLDSLLPRLLEIIESADTLVIYNADFDLSFLPDSIRYRAASKAVCAMQAFALHMGTWNESRQAYRWHKLGVAATVAGHRWDGKAHRALADAMAARSVWLWLHEQVHAEVPLVN